MTKNLQQFLLLTFASGTIGQVVANQYRKAYFTRVVGFIHWIPYRTRFGFQIMQYSREVQSWNLSAQFTACLLRDAADE